MGVLRSDLCLEAAATISCTAPECGSRLCRAPAAASSGETGERDENNWGWRGGNESGNVGDGCAAPTDLGAGGV